MRGMKFVPLGATSFLFGALFVEIAFMVGCERNGQTGFEEGGGFIPEETSFRHKAEAMVERLDGKERDFRQSAYGLCCDIRKESDLEVRKRLIAIYTNIIQNVTVAISPDSLKDEEGLKVIDIRLRNSWHLVEWSTATLFDLDPSSLEGWNSLILGVIRWRDTMAMIDRWMLQNDIKKQWRNRLIAFKRHLSSMYESKVWELGKTYWSLRHKMTPQQRHEVRKMVKAALGELPPEMAKDEAK